MGACVVVGTVNEVVEDTRVVDGVVGCCVDVFAVVVVVDVEAEVVDVTFVAPVVT